MQKKHKSWEKHYNLRRRDVHIKVNDLVLLQTHFLSAAGRKQVEKFMPKFEGSSVSTSSVRPERQREDATNKRRNQSGRIKPIQGDLAHTIYGAVYKKKTESMRTSATSKSTAYLAAHSAEEASVWKR
ncbi:hypothetical protein TNCV_2783481 [Trichonephila clavipes]|nr:hypothetical protein TNCV_2783481 [Trichonephila clavipes]